MPLTYILQLSISIFYYSHDESYIVLRLASLVLRNHLQEKIFYVE